MGYQYRGAEPADEAYTPDEDEAAARRIAALDKQFMAGMGGADSPFPTRLEQAGRLLAYGTSLREVQRITRLSRVTIHRYFPGETRSLSHSAWTCRKAAA